MSSTRTRNWGRIVATGCGFLAALFGAVEVARAEPAFAVRTGYRCSTCHANRTGGGIRTAFGSIYTQTTLPHRPLPWGAASTLLRGNPDARFAFGGDLRGQYLTVDSRELEDVSSFELAEANVYAEARLIPNRLSLYLDERVGPGGASARELFGLFAFADEKSRGYVKVGKFLPAYGWRLPDDAAFVRQFTGFSYTSPDIGVEVGLEPGRWSLHLAAVNGAGGGSDDNRSKRFNLQAVRRFRNWRAGVSGSNNIRGAVTTTHAGILGGANFGRLALLAEGDWVQTRDGAGSDQRLVGLLEADVLLMRGLNIKLAHDWIDPDTGIQTDDRTRDSIGVEYIPYPFIQLRCFVRFRDGPPQVSGSRDDQVELEAHIFF